MKFLALLVLVAAVYAADPPEVATGVPAEPNYTRFSLEEDLAKEMSTIAPADAPSEPPSISISELHHNMESTPAAEPEPTTKQTFIMKITTKSPMMQALMNETMEDGMKPMVEEVVPKPASVKPVEGAHEMKPHVEVIKPVDAMKPVEAMKPMTEKPHEMMENKTMATSKPMMDEHDDDEHYQNDSPVHAPQPEPEPEPEHEEDKKTPKPVAVSTTQKPAKKETPSSKDKLVSNNTTKGHNGASSLSPALILSTITMALLSRLAC